MSLPASRITVGKTDAACTVSCGDSREGRHEVLTDQTLFPVGSPKRGRGRNNS